MNLDDAVSMCTMITFGLIVACPLLSFVLPKVENIHMILSLCALVSSILLSAVVLFPMMNLMLMRVCLFIVGFCSVGYLVPFTIAHYYVRPGSKSTAIGFTNMLATIFGPMISFFIAVIVDFFGKQPYTLNDYQLGLYLLPISMFFASMICFLMPGTHKPGRNDDI
jgi:sugar phosphate permease